MTVALLAISFKLDKQQNVIIRGLDYLLLKFSLNFKEVQSMQAYSAIQSGTLNKQ